MVISEQRKAIARYLASQFGGRPPVTSYTTADKSLEVGIMTAAGSPDEGLSSFASIGLSEHPLVRDGKEFPARVELVAFARDADAVVAQALSTACFTVIRSTRFVAPGIVVRDALKRGAAGELRHLLCASPFTWEPPLVSQTIAGVRVAFLQAVPVTDAEAAFATAAGARALEDLLDAQEVDIGDLGRAEVKLPQAKAAGAKTKTRAAKLGTTGNLDGGWTIALPAGCKRRVEDGSVVFWRKGLTIWSVTASSKVPPARRVEEYLAESTPTRTEERRSQDGGLHRASYRAAGDGSDARRPSLNAIVAAADASLIISFYFDDEESAALCERILDSVARVTSEAPAARS